ncbi:VOC family protein [Flammeovirga sp. EKP202]|uniref:VOC family protein n=1 Tax=Flammeovirga sp. EKP202 TaxID=2770592 RepID=UPI00165EDE64|nr:VOC family protein [Flammeovirga sp. EKP202]MBD0402285.1 VOC family protein [Flammeovirga sp. EKP202]
MKIRKLYLNSTHLEDQLHFYQNTLGIPLLSKNEENISLKVGASELVFQKSEESKPYHFAFNIPFELIEKAVIWLKERVTILKEGASDIQDFSAWKAKAIYFYDKDKNIVELIGREEVSGNGNENFEASSIISISEIGVPSKDIEKVYQSILRSTDQSMPIYDGSFQRFCAVGNPEGLFICINNDKKGTWFPTEDVALSSSFKIDLENEGEEIRLQFKEEEGIFEEE